MLSYAVTRFGHAVEPIDNQDPQPRGTELVLDVLRCGVCHTDLHLQEGHYDLGGGRKLNLSERGINPPVVMGHEIVARLVATGPDAEIDANQIGHDFLIYPWTGCGHCPACKAGQENMCASPNCMGVHRAGGYAEKIVVPHPRYLVDIGDLDPGIAATYACSGLTTYAALKRSGPVPDYGWLLIVGAGGLGQMALQVARALGYPHIVVADIDPAKRAQALEAGAHKVIDPQSSEAIDALAVLEDGIAVAVDFVGAQATAQMATAAIRKGGCYVVVGLFGGEISLPLPAVVLRLISLRGSYVGTLDELHELMRLVRDKNIRPLPVETLPMAQLNTALERLRQGKVQGRLVLTTE